MNNYETSPDLTHQIRCVSHEIRNHLSVCDMYTQIIRKNLAKSGIIPQKGHVYFAPANFHLVIKPGNKNDFIIELNDDAPVNFVRPSVDKMFFSAAEILGNKTIAVLLTGMGTDGAAGCCKIKNCGGYTIAEDEKSCVVYGMPKAAAEAGGAVAVLSLNEIADRLKTLAANTG